MSMSWSGWFLGLVAAILLELGTTEAFAQRHHHHDAAGHMIDHAGHHIDRYGRHTGPVGVYHNQYVPYVYPQQVPVRTYGIGAYNPAVVTVQSVPSNVVPQNFVPSSIPSNTVPRVANGVVTLFNPADSGGEVRYSLNGNVYSIKPGSVQTLQNDRLWVVEFGSGGPVGNVRYSLEPGIYKFKVTEAGWNLFRTQDQPSLGEIPAAPLPDRDGPRPGNVPN